MFCKTYGHWLVSSWHGFYLLFFAYKIWMLYLFPFCIYYQIIVRYLFFITCNFLYLFLTLHILSYLYHRRHHTYHTWCACLRARGFLRPECSEEDANILGPRAVVWNTELISTTTLLLLLWSITPSLSLLIYWLFKSAINSCFHLGLTL